MEHLIFTQPHWETLTPNTQLAFHQLKTQAFIQNFYLAGGTGLALHLGHRFSVDLDFFSENPNSLGSEERAVIRRAVEESTFTITHDKYGTFVATWQGVGLSMFKDALKAFVRVYSD